MFLAIKCRRRDGPFGPPPVQIRTGRFHAYNSSIRLLRVGCYVDRDASRVLGSQTPRELRRTRIAPIIVLPCPTDTGSASRKLVSRLDTSPARTTVQRFDHDVAIILPVAVGGWWVGNSHLQRQRAAPRRCSVYRAHGIASPPLTTHCDFEDHNHMEVAVVACSALNVGLFHLLFRAGLPRHSRVCDFL